MDSTLPTLDARTRRWAWALGLAGLLPFIGHAIAVAWLGPPLAAVAVSSQIIYAALILTFVGGVHWGVVLVAGAGLSSTSIAVRLVWSVVPSLYAFVVAQFTHPRPLGWLAAGLLVALLVDWRLYGRLPSIDLREFRKLRVLLTLVAVASLLLTFWLATPDGAR